MAPAVRKSLTDRFLKSLKAKSNYYDCWDATQPGLGVRISTKGRRTFVLMTRIGKGGDPRRLAIGEYGAVTLADARAIAHEWLKQAKAGKHPAELRARQEENTFANVAEHFIAYIHRQKLRTAPVMERRLREIFIKERGDVWVDQEMRLGWQRCAPAVPPLQMPVTVGLKRKSDGRSGYPEGSH